MLDDIGHVSERQYVVIGNGVLMSVEGNELTVDLVSARELGFVVGLEGNDEQLVVTHHNGPGILSPDRQALGHLSGSDVHHRDFVLR